MNAETAAPGRLLAITGVALQIGAGFALRPVFQGIGNYLHSLVLGGLGDLSTLLPAFSEFLEGGALGFALAGTGLVCFTTALIGRRYRAPWFFWLLIIEGVLLVPVLPIGTVFGGFFVVYCLRRRREFSGGV